MCKWKNERHFVQPCKESFGFGTPNLRIEQLFGAFVRDVWTQINLPTNGFIVRRLDPFQKEKDISDLCANLEWDYVVIQRKHKHEIHQLR